MQPSSCCCSEKALRLPCLLAASQSCSSAASSSPSQAKLGAAFQKRLLRTNAAHHDAIAFRNSHKQQQREHVSWFREAWPYIQGHRGSTFVIVLPGEVVVNRGTLDSVLQDIALLHGLGIRIVLVPGTHVQTDKLLQERGCVPRYVGAYRITDDSAREAAMEAAGKVRVEIEAKLCRAPSMPVLRRHGENGQPGVNVASGNFLSAKRRGVVHGIDFGATGEVRKIDIGRIKERLDGSCIVLLTNMGYTSCGEVLNCNTYEVATACAAALKADKLLCLLDGPVFDENGNHVRFMTVEQADQLIRQRACQSYTAADYVKAAAGASYAKSLGLLKMFESSEDDDPEDGSAVSNKKSEKGLAVGGKERQSRTYGYLSELAASVYACRAGVRRVHLLDSTIEGALLLELYTRDGIGTMVSSDMYEGIRCARPEDVYEIEKLLIPLEESGVLVRRTRDQLLHDIHNYIVVEREGSLIACCALCPYTAEKCGEVGAFAVAPECRRHGIGDNLLDYVEKKAMASNMERVFLLTTRTADWFTQRGFTECCVDDIPRCRRERIDFTRGSKYYTKTLLAPVLVY